MRSMLFSCYVFMLNQCIVVALPVVSIDVYSVCHITWIRTNNVQTMKLTIYTLIQLILRVVCESFLYNM